MRPVVLPGAAAGGSTGRLDLRAAGGCSAGKEEEEEDPLDLRAAGGCAAGKEEEEEEEEEEEAGSGKGRSRPGVGDPSGSLVGRPPGVGVTLQTSDDLILRQHLSLCTSFESTTPRLCVAKQAQHSIAQHSTAQHSIAQNSILN